MKAYESPPYSGHETVAASSPSRSVARNESGPPATKRSASSRPGFHPSASAHEIAACATRFRSISVGDATASKSTAEWPPPTPGTRTSKEGRGEHGRTNEAGEGASQGGGWRRHRQQEAQGQGPQGP